VPFNSRLILQKAVLKLFKNNPSLERNGVVSKLSSEMIAFIINHRKQSATDSQTPLWAQPADIRGSMDSMALPTACMLVSLADLSVFTL
jgi:hypothetical protein